ncbi:zinc finger CCCH domain-containing protein 15 homolog [Neocloeon triangulifer]|uniref:zinc finger CCCH domain-containing protein 15 homolog n=1 Tax=Neocloeon triangulifer TaxID=2078957 RepID=UPI00286F0694|nr:zinc finger CCCH domain-containing protein 15 homolog [Neocloeon triangulifer]XP_059482525.1 zinc finger CCCH domain-containing protein 15 homolog [Neocloeon triangulifer]
MPPKKAPGAAPSKKTELKKKEKVIEDKTFGLKNKKGAKQQKFIQQVEKQVKFGGIPSNRKLEDAKKLELEKKKKEDTLSLLFKPVATQKVEKGVDPKSILCAFFKQGTCGKGDKCKFSHDLTIERKAEKRSLYVDMRDGEEETMEDWDEQKLSEVAEKKHGAADLARPNQTDIICKYFLEAVEINKYGWFWECPNGSKCFYRHALPPGFQLKKDKKKEEKMDKISLEDLIEKERAALGFNLTKVTLETFIAWKKRKLTEKAKNAKIDEEKKRQEFKAGRQVGISGREMFVFNPELAREGDDDFEEGGVALDYRQLSKDDDEDDGIEYKEIVLDDIALEASEADGTGSVATENRLSEIAAQTQTITNGTAEDPGATAAAIDENLFLDDDDLDDLEDELEELEISDS